MPKGFTHLHVHTHYSILDGAATVPKLFSEAERQGMTALAMTDHGNMFGAYDFYTASSKTPVKPIIGIEAYVAPESRRHKKAVFWNPTGRPIKDTTGEGGKDVAGGGRYTHMTMWALNTEGLRNLFRLSTLANFEGLSGGRSRMDKELLSQYTGGIAATTGCPSGEVQTRLRLGQFDKACEAVSFYQDLYGKENYFLELMDHGVPIEQEARKDLLKLARKMGMPLLATNDSHYVTADQHEAHDIYLCIGTGKQKDDPNRLKFNGPYYHLRTEEEMRRLFTELPEACDNTMLLAERVEPYTEAFAYRDRMPVFDVPEGETPASWLKKVCKRGIKQRYPEGPTKEVKARLNTELATIATAGFDSYFLIVSDICNYARSQGIAVGPGRGSATGSMVAYLSGITDIDPLHHGLLFERFLNLERVSPPDIDLDFDDRRREEVIQYCINKYGSDHTAQVNTFGAIKAKQAVKDSARVLGYPYALGDRITKALPPDQNGHTMSLAGVFDPKDPRYKEAQELRDLYEGDREVRTVVDAGRGIEGLVRGFGVHAAALIISSEPLIDVLPLHRRERDGAILTGFSYPQCEDIGLLKMDFLGLRNLGVIQHALEMVNARHGGNLTTTSIPLDDEATYQMLARGDTLGVFQMDGSGYRNLLRILKPTTYDDITAIGALYRPGPMASNAHIAYADRKNGRQPVEPIHPELKEPLAAILGPTYHLLVYQEQVMGVAREMAGYSLGQADLLRRAMGKKKKEVLDQNFQEFLDGALAKGYSRPAVQAMWDTMVPFSGYGFNKSHSAGYAMPSYWTAYLKANYPEEFMSALLTSVGDNKDRMAIYLAECRAMGVKVLQPDINESAATFSPVGEKTIRFGLSAVHNVGGNVVSSILSTRKKHGKFDSFHDFLDKADVAACAKKPVESLIKAGTFDSLGHHRRSLHARCELIIDALLPAKRQEALGQDGLFGVIEQEQSTPVKVRPGEFSEGEWPRRVLLAHEKEMLGLYVSDHPLSAIAHRLAPLATAQVGHLYDEERPDGEMVTVAGLISGLTKKVTKKGNLWAVFQVEDLTGTVEVLAFPATWQLISEQVADDAIAVATGRVDRKEGATRIILSEVKMPHLTEEDKPLTFTLKAEDCTKGKVRSIKRILAAHPGTTEVRLHYVEGGKTTVFRLGLAVHYKSGLVGELKALLGAQSFTTTGPSGQS